MFDQDGASYQRLTAIEGGGGVVVTVVKRTGSLCVEPIPGFEGVCVCVLSVCLCVRAPECLSDFVSAPYSAVAVHACAYACACACACVHVHVHVHVNVHVHV